MANIRINEESCVGCGLCVNACPFSAISIEGETGKRIAKINEKCVLCGACVESCKLSAILLDSKKKSEINGSEYSGIWVFCEQSGGKLRSVGLELLGEARHLAHDLGTDVTAVLMEDEGGENARTLIAYGADKVIHVTHPRLKDLNDLDCTDAFFDIVNTGKPEIILVGATAFGRSFSPRLAARLGTGLTADCTSLDIDREKGLLLQTRPAFGGNLMATIVCPDQRPQMASVRPKVFAMAKPDMNREGEIVTVAPKLREIPLMDIISQVRKDEEGAFNIADADILISVGAGIGNSKNIALAEELASLLGGSVSCSRPLVDNAWCGYSHQVGQTGKTVSPKVYIAFGISGAVQHMAGVAAETVIAVNSDPDAPIFNRAHYGIVGDCVEVMQSMIDEARR